MKHWKEDFCYVGWLSGMGWNILCWNWLYFTMMIDDAGRGMSGHYHGEIEYIFATFAISMNMNSGKSASTQLASLSELKCLSTSAL